MPDPTQFDPDRVRLVFDPDRVRLVLDHGEVVELDGGTLVLDGEESPSVLLRLTPWRAQSVARVLQEWSSVSRIFHHAPRPPLDELELSRTLELAAAVLGSGDEPVVRSSRGSRVVSARQCLAAVAVLGEREADLSAVQRLAWSMPLRGGSRNPTAARSLPMHCWLRVARPRSPPNTST
jgi:hypothetical protein